MRTENEAGAVRCRQIVEADLDGTVDLLQAGFPYRARRYWTDGLKRIGSHHSPAGSPRYGYVLEASGRLVGVLLLISSRSPANCAAVRANVSSWFVLPEYRTCAPLLVLRAIRQKGPTYANISPADHTRSIIEAQGFHKAAEGVHAAIPAFMRLRHRARISVLSHEFQSFPGIDPQTLALMLDHLRFGCIVVWCETEVGAFPIVMRERRLKFRGLRAAQLIYTQSIRDLEAAAGALGRFLLGRGIPLLLVGSSERLQGVPGRYFPNRLPIYLKGNETRDPFDLAYTEAALLGL
jgi:hypothetical protein